MDAMTRSLQELTPLRSMQKLIEAHCYNHARLALRRASQPVRVSLPRHRCLEVIVEDHGWLCVDSAQDDLPILAWHDFDTTRHNAALHEPVPCQLDLYHMQAGLIMGTALEALDEALADFISASSL